MNTLQKIYEFVDELNVAGLKEAQNYIEQALATHEGHDCEVEHD